MRFMILPRIFEPAVRPARYMYAYLYKRNPFRLFEYRAEI